MGNIEMSKSEVTIRTRVQIRRMFDGVVVTTNGPDFSGATRSEAIEAANYWWSDGNGGCDCSRIICFNRAGGEPEEDVACSGGLFLVKVVDADSGDVIVDELDDVTPDSAD